MIKHKLSMERNMDEYCEILKDDFIFSVDFKAWSLTEFEAQKLFRAIENLLDGVMPEDEKKRSKS